MVLIGEGDLSQDLGFPRQYEHPTVAAAIAEILSICKEAGVPCGHPHVDTRNVERLLEQGFRWLMASPERSFNALELGRKRASRNICSHRFVRSPDHPGRRAAGVGGTSEHKFRALRRVMMAAALALVAGLPAGVYAQADGTDDAPVADSVDSAVAPMPTLQCSVIALRALATEMGGARFVCHVDGAQPGDTAFTAQAAADSQPAVRIAGCTGTLEGGVGDCVGGFVDRASSTIGQFSISATLEPSGSTLGPVVLASAAVTPPAQPKPLLGTSPTAPINYFPLPEP